MTDHAGAILTIDLGAITNNYRLLRTRGGEASCGAVVKADAYGLGAAQVGPALAAAGCTEFFVAQIDEGIALRESLGGTGTIYILNGVPAGATDALIAHRLVPVLNSLSQIDLWSNAAAVRDVILDAIVQIDTGMSRLGLSLDELAIIAADPGRLSRLAVRGVMSHLSSADHPEDPANAAALTAFKAALRQLPPTPASLANSSGIFLGSDYHFDLLRPGAALYGVNPTPKLPNPMQPAIRLQGRVIQVRTIAPGVAVGYNGHFVADSARRIATIAVGYADGFLRSLSDRASAALNGIALPIVGAISMDLIGVDVTTLPEGKPEVDSFIDLIGGSADGVDDIAAQAGTIGYEILTSLGRRYHRHYIWGDSS